MTYDENSNKDLARITYNVRNNTGRCSTEKSENKKKRGQRRKVRRGVADNNQYTAASTKQNNAAAGSTVDPQLNLGPIVGLPESGFCEPHSPDRGGYARMSTR